MEDWISYTEYTEKYAFPEYALRCIFFFFLFSICLDVPDLTNEHRTTHHCNTN